MKIVISCWILEKENCLAFSWTKSIKPNEMQEKSCKIFSWRFFAAYSWFLSLRSIEKNHKWANWKRHFLVTHFAQFSSFKKEEFAFKNANLLEIEANIFSKNIFISKSLVGARIKISSAERYFRKVRPATWIENEKWRVVEMIHVARLTVAITISLEYCFVLQKKVGTYVCTDRHLWK